MITVEEAIKIPEVSVLMNVIRLFNEDIYNHCVSVAKVAERILVNTDTFTEEEKNNIIIGAVLHDIGKIFVPFNLTESPRRLSENEFEIVKIHTRIGNEILKNDFPEIVSNIAQYHHEKPNGTGYNSGLPLALIPKEALIIQVCDIYDALVSRRRYKNGYDSEVAIEIMKNDCKHFKIDDEYLDLLIKMLKEYEEE